MSFLTRIISSARIILLPTVIEEHSSHTEMVAASGTGFWMRIHRWSLCGGDFPKEKASDIGALVEKSVAISASFITGPHNLYAGLGAERDLVRRRPEGSQGSNKEKFLVRYCTVGSKNYSSMFSMVIIKILFLCLTIMNMLQWNHHLHYFAMSDTGWFEKSRK